MTVNASKIVVPRRPTTIENEHGYCPACGADMDGDGIWAHFYIVSGGDEAYADRTAEMYGADRRHGKWGRVVGHASIGDDRVGSWECPDCHHMWGRR